MGRGEGMGLLCSIPLSAQSQPCALRGWQQAVGTQVLIQSPLGGLWFFLPLLT